MTVTIGLHLITRHETDRLEACLASLAPIQFEQIVIGVTSQEGWDGETRCIAERYGEAVDLTWLPKLTFPDYGECIASFAQARQAVYDWMTTDWVFWIDADDVLDGAEELRPIIERIDQQGFGCLFLDYHYGFDNSGNCITILKRERAVKRSVGWKWVRRVHEGLMAQGPVQFAKTDDVTIIHNSPTGRGWPKRNLELLLLDYEENPNDKRTVCYIGHQYYATQDWDDAAIWYEKYVKMEDRAIERWQALHFLADCYRQTERYQQAITKDLEAMLLMPEWNDPYFGMAETYARQGDWDKVIWWDKLGRIARPATDAIFFNPLDSTYNPALFSNIAWANKGDLDKARQIVAEAAEVAPAAEHLQQQLANYDALIQQRDKAMGLMKLWEGAPDDAILKTPVPNDLLNVPAVKERITHAAHQIRRPGRPWAVFFCGKSLENWGPPSLHEGGIGGSETAVIHMAQLLGKAGWTVDVYNMPGMYAGTYDGVGYWPFQWYDANTCPELLIGWRQNGMLLADYNVGGLVKWCYCHDLHMGNNITPERAAFYDRIMGVSQWHSDYMQMVYPFLNNLKPTRNGIDRTRFYHEVERNPFKVVYSSSPDRGMVELLKMWPLVVRAVPQAELHLYYGWDNIDKYPQMQQFKQQVVNLIERTPCVTWHGRVNQDELAKEFLSAGVWAYPTAFLEVSCITAMEAMAAGVAILSSDCGALPETVGDRGILVKGRVNTEPYQRQFVGHLVSLLQNEEWRSEWAVKGLAHASSLGWEKVAEDWIAEWEVAAGNVALPKSGAKFLKEV